MGQANYSAAKAGDIGFVKALAQEGAAKGITVNAICPGYIGTEMVQAVPPEVLEKRILPHDPGRPPRRARGDRALRRVPRLRPVGLHHRRDAHRQWRPVYGLNGAVAMTETAPTQELFLEQWQVYRKMVDNDYLFHRGAYDCLHRYLRDEVTAPFRFLEAACGDAGKSSEALLGTKVSDYHGIDISQQALEIAAAQSGAARCPVTFEERDFVSGIARLAEARRCRLDRALPASPARGPAKAETLRDIRRIVGASGRLLIYEDASPDGESREQWLGALGCARAIGRPIRAREWRWSTTMFMPRIFRKPTQTWHALGKERRICARHDAFRVADQSASALPLPGVSRPASHDAMSRRAATLIGFIAVLMWAVLALLSAASGEVPPFQLAAMTFLIGGLLGVASWPFRPSAVASLAQNWRVWALGVAGLFGYHFVYFSAIRAAPPVEVSLLAYLWPLFLVVFSALLPGERLRWYHLAGVVLGLCRRAARDQRRRCARHWLSEWRFGHLLGFACAIIWAGYSVLSRRFASVPTDIVAGFCLATAALAAICHLLFETTVWPNGTMQWLAVIGLGLMPVGAAFYSWDYGVKHGDIMVLGASPICRRSSRP